MKELMRALLHIREQWRMKGRDEDTGVTYGIKGEHVEEIGSAIVILDGVSGKGEWSQSSCAKEQSRVMHIE